jgi:serine/threonine protein kinase
MAESDPLIGQTLAYYRILEQLGSGGMGVVYRARDTRLGREVAVKVLPAVFANDPERLHRFVQEARAVAALNHPNILSVHDIGERDGLHFIVTELLQGKTLRQHYGGHAPATVKLFQDLLRVFQPSGLKTSNTSRIAPH